MSAQTLGFAVQPEDRPVLDELVAYFGDGNRSAYLRATLKVMKSIMIADQLREAQAYGQQRTAELDARNRAFAEQMLAAYDTEKRLQAQGLAPEFSIESFVIEAGPSFFDGAVKQVGQGIDSVTAELQKRDATSYTSDSK